MKCPHCGFRHLSPATNCARCKKPMPAPNPGDYPPALFDDRDQTDATRPTEPPAEAVAQPEPPKKPRAARPRTAPVKAKPPQDAAPEATAERTAEPPQVKPMAAKAAPAAVASPPAPKPAAPPPLEKKKDPMEYDPDLSKTAATPPEESDEVTAVLDEAPPEVTAVERPAEESSVEIEDPTYVVSEEKKKMAPPSAAAAPTPPDNERSYSIEDLGEVSAGPATGEDISLASALAEELGTPAPPNTAPFPVPTPVAPTPVAPPVAQPAPVAAPAPPPAPVRPAIPPAVVPPAAMPPAPPPAPVPGEASASASDWSEGRRLDTFFGTPPEKSAGPAVSSPGEDLSVIRIRPDSVSEVRSTPAPAVPRAPEVSVVRPATPPPRPAIEPPVPEVSLSRTPAPRRAEPVGEESVAPPFLSRPPEARPATLPFGERSGSGEASVYGTRSLNVPPPDRGPIGRRFLAGLIDFASCTAIAYALVRAAIWVSSRGEIHGTLHEWIFLIVLPGLLLTGLITFAWQTIFLFLSGRTPGMAAAGLVFPQRLSLVRILSRSAVLAIEIVPLFLGLIIGYRGDGWWLHDNSAGVRPERRGF